MSIGAQLRAAREARGLTLDAVARATRVQPRILTAIEQDNVSAVPPRPFGRGFVKAYADELGLDGEMIARDYFARFAPPVPALEAVADTLPGDAARPRAWIYAVGVVGLAVGVGLAFMARTSDRDQEAAPQPAAPAVGSSGQAPEPAVAATPPVAPMDRAAPITDPIAIVLIAQRPAWVTATADGHREIYRILAPGAPTHLTAAREVAIRVGDAGAISWRVNGRDAGPMGRSGQVRDVRITAANVSQVQ